MEYGATGEVKLSKESFVILLGLCRFRVDVLHTEGEFVSSRYYPSEANDNGKIVRINPIAGKEDWYHFDLRTGDYDYGYDYFYFVLRFIHHFAEELNEFSGWHLDVDEDHVRMHYRDGQIYESANFVEDRYSEEESNYEVFRKYSLAHKNDTDFRSSGMEDVMTKETLYELLEKHETVNCFEDDIKTILFADQTLRKKYFNMFLNAYEDKDVSKLVMDSSINWSPDEGFFYSTLYKKYSFPEADWESLDSDVSTLYQNFFNFLSSSEKTKVRLFYGEKEKAFSEVIIPKFIAEKLYFTDEYVEVEIESKNKWVSPCTLCTSRLLNEVSGCDTCLFSELI